MNNKARNYILGGVVLLLVILTISVSYAFFRARILGNEDALKNKVQAGTLELSFVDNDAISIENRKPGSNASKTFSVTNTSTLDEDFTYNIKLVMTELTFVKRDLKYILEEYPDSNFTTPKEGGIKEEGYINADSVNEKNEMYLAVDIPRPAKGATHYYKLTVDFQELNIRQDYNQEAIFRGKVNVDDEKDMKVYEQAPNAPELYQGMIPVYFNDGKIYIADASKDDWYDYDNNEWANAILIDYQNNKDKFYDGDTLKVNTVVNEEDILQMYVWIPRYRYKLFNADNKGVPKQLIDIEFEKDTETTGNVICTTASNGKETCKNAENGNWYTHPAFTFGNTELKGFWVGKFEPSDPTDTNGRTKRDINEITILPNKTSMVFRNVNLIFSGNRNIEQIGNKYNLDSKIVDTHMAKNIEWGAVTYLTQSVYGIYKDEKNCNIQGMDKDTCEVWINNTAQGSGRQDVTYTFGGSYTGCVGNSVSAETKWNDNDNSPAKCVEENKWNTTNGVKASTTGNMYGVYDMNGGTSEYVMALIMNEDGTDLYYNTNYSKFSKDNMPNKKYYDVYEFSSDKLTHERGHLGDATRETLETFGEHPGGWNEDSSGFPSISEIIGPWFVRGGVYVDSVHTGIFGFHFSSGIGASYMTFRPIITAQDGVD